MAILGYVGLFLYLFLFFFILQRNIKLTRLELRNEKYFNILYTSIYDKNNPPFFPALWICILSIATYIMYGAFNQGELFNMIQQGCYVYWEVSLYIHILYVLDPFNRVILQLYLKKISYFIYFLLILMYLTDMILIFILHSKRDSIIRIYFLGIALFLMCVSAIVANLLTKIYFSCLRGLSSSQNGNLLFYSLIYYFIILLFY